MPTPQGSTGAPDDQTGSMDWLSRLIAQVVLSVGPRFSPVRYRRLTRGHWVRQYGGEHFEIPTGDGEVLEGLFFKGRGREERERGEGDQGTEGTRDRGGKTLGDANGESSESSSPLVPRSLVPSVPSDRVPSRQPLPIVFAHGWLEVKESRVRVAARMIERGHDVIVFDHRAHGRSTGRFCSFGVYERDDVTAVIDELQRRGWIGDKVVTMGVSLGASIVLQHAPDDPRVAGVVAFAPFVSMSDAVESYRGRYGPMLNAAWLQRGFRQVSKSLGFEMTDASTIEAIKRIKVPVLIMVGQNDRNLSAQKHARVLAAAMEQGDCTLVEVPQAHHFNLLKFDWPGMEEAFWRFCERFEK